MGCKGNHQGQDNISRPSSQGDTTTTDGSEVARERSCHQIPEREEKERERERVERGHLLPLAEVIQPSPRCHSQGTSLPLAQTPSQCAPIDRFYWKPAVLGAGKEVQ